MHRFFVSPEKLEEGGARLDGGQARQIARVLRGRKGEPLVLLDNSGWEYLVQLTAVSDEVVQARVVERRPAVPEPTVSIVLYQSTLKGKKFDWVLQKGTEIGVAAFVPLLCMRCVALPSADRSGRRWSGILVEAAEQCGRGKVPVLAAPMSFREACRQAPHSSYLLSEDTGFPGLKETVRRASRDMAGSVGLFVGPEGGFAPDEVSYAQECGLLPVSLGRRILRGETAGLVAASLLLYEAGDLG